MTTEQARWASSHEWFKTYYPDPVGTMVVVAIDECVDREGRVTRNIVSFTDYRELRAWAGY